MSNEKTPIPAESVKSVSLFELLNTYPDLSVFRDTQGNLVVNEALPNVGKSRRLFIWPKMGEFGDEVLISVSEPNSSDLQLDDIGYTYIKIILDKDHKPKICLSSSNAKLDPQKIDVRDVLEKSIVGISMFEKYEGLSQNQQLALPSGRIYDWGEILIRDFSKAQNLMIALFNDTKS